MGWRRSPTTTASSPSAPSKVRSPRPSACANCSPAPSAATGALPVRKHCSPRWTSPVPHWKTGCATGSSSSTVRSSTTAPSSGTSGTGSRTASAPSSTTIKLTHATLEKLTYAYLGDWIRRQQDRRGSRRSPAATPGSRPPGCSCNPASSSSSKANHPTTSSSAGSGNVATIHRLAPRPQRRRPHEHPPLHGHRPPRRQKRSRPPPHQAQHQVGQRPRQGTPTRYNSEFPWFWQGSTFTGDRLNDIHLTREQKDASRKTNK
jgi:hypothetical protein